MEKIDLRKELKELYNPSVKEIKLIKIPKMNFIMIDGEGNPNSSEKYKESIEILFKLSYTLKFMIKKEKVADYSVMPLEGLWWMDDMNKFSAENKDLWKWTSMIMQPEFITKKIFDSGKKSFMEKKKIESLDHVRFESFNEGLSAQIMYLGPYAEEGPTIQMIHNFIKNQGLKLSGKHHEIYLGDPRRSAPEKLKTIIRQPVQ